MNKKYLVHRIRSDTDNVLVHHGTKGQKWGIRKYQNPDGSLTPAGVRRYGTVEKMDQKRSRNRKIAIGAGVATAVVAGTIVARKSKNNKKIKKELSGLRTAQTKRNATNAKRKITRTANKAKKAKAAEQLALAIASGKATPLSYVKIKTGSDVLISTGTAQNKSVIQTILKNVAGGVVAVRKGGKP